MNKQERSHMTSETPEFSASRSTKASTFSVLSRFHSARPGRSLCCVIHKKETFPEKVICVHENCLQIRPSLRLLNFPLWRRLLWFLLLSDSFISTKHHLGIENFSTVIFLLFSSPMENFHQLQICYKLDYQMMRGFFRSLFLCVMFDRWEKLPEGRGEKTCESEAKNGRKKGKH